MLIDQTSSKLNATQKHEIEKLVIEYQDIFTGPDGKLGRMKLVQHVIDTGDAKPIKIPPRRALLFQRKIIENEIQKMLDVDIIQESNSAWSSPILLVAKKRDPSDPPDKVNWRFCRGLNTVSKKDAFPIPRIDTSFDVLGGNKWFSTVHLTSGYWQCDMDPKVKKRLLFLHIKVSMNLKF